MNSKIYYGNVQPNHKEFKIWVNDEGIIKTWDGNKWNEQSSGDSGNGGSDNEESVKPKWTGHADVEGLKAIGWTDEDIAYYQANGVNWNKEDDEYHKVSEDNKALYGVLTIDNLPTYVRRIVYLPKIDTSGLTSMSYMFSSCYTMVAIPLLDTSKVTNMYDMFNNCYSLVSIPLLDTSKVTDMSGMFTRCYSLVSIPQLNTQNVTTTQSMFSNCSSLVSIPQLNTSNVTNMRSMFYGCYSLVSIPQLNTQNVINMVAMFDDCRSLISIPQLNMQNITSTSSMFHYCYSLVTANLKNVTLACQLNNATNLSKESLLYIINNEASTSAITITLEYLAYNRLANDPDVVQALTKHPNISLAQYV